MAYNTQLAKTQYPQHWTVLESAQQTPAQPLDEMSLLWKLMIDTLGENGFAARSERLFVASDTMTFNFSLSMRADKANIHHVKRIQQVANTLTRQLNKRVEIGMSDFNTTIYIRL